MIQKNRVTLEEAEANARAIRKLWRTGRASQRRIDKIEKNDSASIRYGRCAQTYEAEAKILKINIDAAAKIRRVASDFTENHIERICGLVIKHLAPFSTSQLVVALRAPIGKQRDDLIRRAIVERWTTPMLRHAIQALHGGRRRQGGRKPRIPTDPSEILVALNAVAIKFIRFADDEAIRDSLPRNILLLVDKAVSDVNKLNTAVEERLKQAAKNVAK